MAQVEQPGFRVHQQPGYRLAFLEGPYALGLDVAGEAEPDDRFALSPTPPARRDEPFVSGALIAHKLQSFSDGLRATMALVLQRGSGLLGGTAAFLQEMTRRGASGETALAINQRLNIALSLGSDAPLPPNMSAALSEEVESFLARPELSQPMGPYIWRRELAAIFYQERFLQAPLPAEQAEALARMLHAQGDVRAAYKDLLKLRGILTTSLPGRSLAPLLEALDGGAAVLPARPFPLFPPLRRRALDMIVKLTGESRIPAAVPVYGEFLRRYLGGTHDFTPSAGSGWYDYLAWALEALTAPERMPESARLRLTEAYRETLFQIAERAIEDSASLRRGALGPTAPPGPPPSRRPSFEVYPRFNVEPLPEYYLRCAFTLRFLRSGLEDVLGAQGLAGLRRLGPAGPNPLELAAEMRGLEAILYGAYVVARRQLGFEADLGLELGSGQGGAVDARIFLAWAERIDRDADLGPDLRCLVPVGYDPKTRRYEALAYLGWVQRVLRVTVPGPPMVELFDPSGAPLPFDQASLSFRHSDYPLAAPVVVRVSLAGPVSEGDFRALCDRERQPEAIVAALEA